RACPCPPERSDESATLPPFAWPARPPAVHARGIALAYRRDCTSGHGVDQGHQPGDLARVSPDCPGCLELVGCPPTGARTVSRTVGRRSTLCIDAVSLGDSLA